MFSYDKHCCFNNAKAYDKPRLTGGSAERHWPGGGAYSRLPNAPPPPANSRDQ